MAKAKIVIQFANNTNKNSLTFTQAGEVRTYTTSSSPQPALTNATNFQAMLDQGSSYNTSITTIDGGFSFLVAVEAADDGASSNLTPLTLNAFGGSQSIAIVSSYSVPPCDLAINSISTSNDVNAQGVGVITVNATSSFSMEYSLDGTNWQSSNIFSNKSSGNYTIRVRDSNGCIKSKTASLSNTACSLTFSSTSFTHETGVDANDGTISILATSGAGGVKYSLDGGSLQNTGNFTGIAPGVHSVYLSDAANCTTSQNFTINEFIPPASPTNCFDPTIDFSTVNPIQFRKIKCNNQQSEKLYQDDKICGVYKDCFYQLLNCSDTVTFQLFYQESEYSTVPVMKVRDLSNDAILDTINLINLGDGFYQMEKPVTEIIGICEKFVSLEIKSKANSDATEYYTHAKSEPILVSDFHDCSLVLEYWNQSDYAGMIYEGNEGYRNKLRIFAQFWKTSHPQEKEVYRKSNGELVKLREEITKRIKFKTGYLPEYIHEKIALALSHDHVQINNIEYVLEEDYKEEEPENRYELYKGEAELTHKTYYKKNLIK